MLTHTHKNPRKKQLLHYEQTRLRIAQLNNEHFEQSSSKDTENQIPARKNIDKT